MLVSIVGAEARRSLVEPPMAAMELLRMIEPLLVAAFEKAPTSLLPSLPPMDRTPVLTLPAWLSESPMLCVGAVSLPPLESDRPPCCVGTVSLPPLESDLPPCCWPSSAEAPSSLLVTAPNDKDKLVS